MGRGAVSGVAAHHAQHLWRERRHSAGSDRARHCRHHHLKRSTHQILIRGTRGRPAALISIRHRLALTAELVAEVYRLEADPGPEQGSIELSIDDYHRAAQSIAQQNADHPLWLFAYGS